MNRLLDASVLAGPIPLVITIAGLAAATVLLVRRGRDWWRRAVPIAVAAAALGAAAVGWVANGWWRPFPDPLPLRVLCWIGVALFGLGLAAATWLRPPASTRRRALAAPLLAVLLALPAMKINAFYGYYPSVRTVLGIPAANEIALADVPATVPSPPPAGSLAQAWQPPPDLPAAGRTAKVDIPGTVSGFPARPGSVYLPPAYLSSQRRPLLPVLVLIAGQPGSPQDWLTAGKLAQVMDRFAAAHRGLAPIVVMPDATGSTLGNPLCLDSRLDNAETYLARDVPNWIATTLQVDPDLSHRAIAGFSYGGTCALQLAVRQPGVYPTYLDISGQAEPSLGTRAQTVAAAFGGDQAAFRAVNPLDILTATTFPASTGIIAVGRDDPVYGPQARTVLAATRNAGMAVQLLEVPGGHTWPVATTALDTALPDLARRLGLL
ncbi:alpha/beta hydrolase family protein [Pseudonocardia sp. MH-G8]|uniref:alpha/beta hydrolase n=1 Tax=Pseudonocardia sp. MH-G8 TaxID=1854588 RepID=UPI000B9FBA9E|nr:alpha/beta hydrolase-fold protein [Pseudonocardia sp. MH-G8]OZM76381.1 esterase [Pseudonocardia sp. MH-G8]